MKCPLSLAVVLTLTLGCLAAAGCSSIGLGEQHDAARVEKLSKLIYPLDSKRGQDLDILVVRSGQSLSLINRTPQAFYNVELWLNQQYVNILPRLEIGQATSHTHLSLSSFINEHREVYPVGGLLTPEKNQLLLIAELFDPATGLRHHLLVQNR